MVSFNLLSLYSFLKRMQKYSTRNLLVVHNQFTGEHLEMISSSGFAVYFWSAFFIRISLGIFHIFPFHLPRRFYLTGGMTSLCSFIRGFLEWPFSEFFLSDASLWNQYKFIAFDICLCIILILHSKILIITVISNEPTNESTIHAKLCRNVTIFYRLLLASLCQVLEKLRSCGDSKVFE